MANRRAFEETSRLAVLDGLRGWAIAGVILVHCGQTVPDLPPVFKRLADYGGRGVQFFFILSALTLLTVYNNRPVDWRNFYIRRFFRLAPMFYVGCLLYYGLAHIGWHNYTPPGITLGEIMLDIGFLQSWHASTLNNLMPGGWSISDEAMFYLLFPFLLTQITTLKRGLIAFVLALILSRLSFTQLPDWLDDAHDYASFVFPTQLVSFVCGFVIFRALRHPLHIPVIPIAGLILAAAIASWPWAHNYLLADILFSVLILAIYYAPPACFTYAWLCRIGRISYSIYIVHFAFIDAARLWVQPQLTMLSPILQGIIVYSTVTIAAIITAHGTWIVIEQPAIRFGRRLSGET